MYQKILYLDKLWAIIYVNTVFFIHKLLWAGYWDKRSKWNVLKSIGYALGMLFSDFYEKALLEKLFLSTKIMKNTPSV